MSEARLKLIAEKRRKQPLDELARKAMRAAQRGWFTAEDVDYAAAWADDMAAYFAATVDQSQRYPSPPRKDGT